jgi:hypothetical protein
LEKEKKRSWNNNAILVSLVDKGSGESDITQHTRYKNKTLKYAYAGTTGYYGTKVQNISVTANSVYSASLVSSADKGAVRII